MTELIALLPGSRLKLTLIDKAGKEMDLVVFSNPERTLADDGETEIENKHTLLVRPPVSEMSVVTFVPKID